MGSGLPEVVNLSEHNGTVGFVGCSEADGCFFGSNRQRSCVRLFTSVLRGESFSSLGLSSRFARVKLSTGGRCSL